MSRDESKRFGINREVNPWKNWKTRGFYESDKEPSWKLCGVDRLRSWLETKISQEKTQGYKNLGLRLGFDRLASEEKKIWKEDKFGMIKYSKKKSMGLGYWELRKDD